MNFSDRVKITRRTTAPGGGSFSYLTLFDSQPCRFEILTAFGAMGWTGNVRGGYQSTSANLRLPLTFPDLPENGFTLEDYTFRVVSPDLGFMPGGPSKIWSISGKRFTRNHVLYHLELV